MGVGEGGCPLWPGKQLGQLEPMLGRAGCGNQMAAAARSVLRCLGCTALGRRGGGSCLACLPVGFCWCNAGFLTSLAGRFTRLVWGLLPVLPLLGLFRWLDRQELVCSPGVSALPPVQCVPKVARSFSCAACLIAFCISFVACVWRRGWTREGAAHQRL